MNEFEGKLCEILGKEKVRTKELMNKHTTFRVGGPAAYYVLPDKKEQLAKILKLCSQSEVPYYILGNGSNLLVSDQGFQGVVIAMEEGFHQIEVRDQRVMAGAGAMLSRISKAALKENLAGMEFAAGIPGTLGGAVVMNAGAYGGEMKHMIEMVTVMDRSGRVMNLTAEELELGYRTSNVLKNHYIVLEAVLRLHPGDQDAIGLRMEELSRQRKLKQPLEYPSAGSTFKRPEGYFAGKLIDDAGLRGYQVGGAQISEKHCGFVINKDHASAEDIMELCRAVSQKVQASFGVELEMEVKTLGDF